MNKDKLWDTVIFFTVILVLLLLVYEYLVDMFAYEDLFFQAEMLILFIFVMDLGVLYGKSKDYKDFFKSNWLDIIATIPFGQLFRIAKLLRLVKLIKSFKIFSKTTKLIHIEKMIKIFSKKEVVGDMMEKKE